MSDFERIYQIDLSQEANHPIEKHLSIELSDREYLQTRVSKEMEEASFVYKEPPPEEEMSFALKEKFKKAKNICQDTKVTDLPFAEPPPISMNLEMPRLEKSIRQGKNNAKSKSETPKRKLKKDNSEIYKPTMESLQS